MTDSIALGSIFPDMLIGGPLSHNKAHSIGYKLLETFRDEPDLSDFARAVVTHGIDPGGLDYFGDEKYLDYEKGYCFEKALPLINATTRACNLPPEMGWWKAHNIIEMGIELRISESGPYWEILQQAFRNESLIMMLGQKLAAITGLGPWELLNRIRRFPRYIVTHRATSSALASKYQIQMIAKHGIDINVPAVAGLIELASSRVETDIDDFFQLTNSLVQQNLAQVEHDLNGYPAPPGGISSSAPLKLL
ncbi:MAG: hypothetical protein AB1815_10095 [Bacillota bacterium]